MKKTLFLAILPLLSLLSFTSNDNKVNAGEREIVYQTDFEGIYVDKDHTADSTTGFIWANAWEQTKTEQHNGSNMLNVTIPDKDAYGYSIIGGFGIGMNSNLALCTLGESYRTTTYFEFGNAEFIFVEFVGGSGKWGSVKVYPNGQVLANPGGDNMWGVTYENNILSFAFTMAFNTDENVNGYIKFTAFNAVNANLYIDDVVIERESNTYAADYEDDPLGTVNTTDTNYFGQLYSDSSTIEVVNYNNSKQVKVSYTPNTQEGVSAFFLNHLAMLNKNREYKVSMDISVSNVDSLVIYYGGLWVSNPSYLIIDMSSKTITNNGTAFSEVVMTNNTLTFKFVANLSDGNYKQFQFIGESSSSASNGVIYIDNIFFKQVAIVDEIELDTTNAKLVFEYGEAFSTDGLVVYGCLTDGSKRVLPKTEYETNGYNSHNVGNQRITVSVGDIDTYYIIKVIRTAVGLEVNLKEIKTSYKHGEPLDLSNLIVRAIYKDDVKEELTHDAILGGYWLDFGGFDAYQEGKYTITVFYQTINTTFEVTVGAIEKVDFTGTSFEQM